MEYSIDLIPAAIYLLVPFLGAGAFLLLCRRMARLRIPSPPYWPWFILAGAFGGWLLVVLTALWWQWSGMASIGVFTLVLIAPVVAAALALRLRESRTLSRFHRRAFVAAVGYSLSMLAAILVWAVAACFR